MLNFIKLFWEETKEIPKYIDYKMKLRNSDLIKEIILTDTDCEERMDGSLFLSDEFLESYIDLKSDAPINYKNKTKKSYQYYVFAYEDYYPHGGADENIYQSNSLFEVKEFIIKQLNTKYNDYETFHVLDTDTSEWLVYCMEHFLKFIKE